MKARAMRHTLARCVITQLATELFVPPTVVRMRGTLTRLRHLINEIASCEWSGLIYK